MNSPNNNKRFFFQKKNKVKYIISVLLFLVWGNGSFGQEINPDGHNVFYYENGRVASEGNFENGLPHGIWKSYYADGTLKSIGNKKAGQSDSTWIFFDSQGRKKQVFEYAADKKNGCARYFDTLGNVVKEMLYINDVAQGERIEFYPDGSVKSKVEIIDGKEIGLLLEYNPEGAIITEEIYDNGYLKDRKEFNRYDRQGRKTGVWRTFFPDGTLESEVGYKEGEKSGLSKVYNKKGKLIDLQRMEGDTVAGHSDELVIIELYKEFYDNGKIKLVGGLDNGMRTGIFREYDQEGEIVNGYLFEQDTMVAEGFIRADGIYEGEWTYFYRTGVVKAKGSYENGQKVGKWVYYYADGKKEQEGTFKENKLSGNWTWYYQNGQVKRKEFYNRKELLEGTVFEYDSLGNEMTRGDYYNGLREGEWYYHVGDYKEVGEFTLGLENGVWNYYYLNGKLAFTGSFEEGEARGKHVYYHQNGFPKRVGKYLGGEKHGKWKEFNELGEIIQVIEYRRGEIYKIDGFKVSPVIPED